MKGRILGAGVCISVCSGLVWGIVESGIRAKEIHSPVQKTAQVAELNVVQPSARDLRATDSLPDDSLSASVALASPMRVQLDLERYHYQHGEAIPVSLRIEGVADSPGLTAVVQLRDRKNNVLVQKTVVAPDNTDTMKTTFEPGERNEWQDEMQVVASIELNNRLMSISAPVSYLKTP